MKKSFIVTGASASGKSTLIREAIYNKYIYLPTHMTRKMRDNEEDGKDAIFLSKEQFEENFRNNEYIEPSLDFALYKAVGEYYGSPKSWLDDLNEDNHCASPVSIRIAEMIKEQDPILWLHLYCNSDDRMQRLMSRGISEEEAYKRMTCGDSVNIPQEAIPINTSEYSAKEIIEQIDDMEQ